MAEQFANLCATTVAVGGYTAGSGVLDVATTAAPWPQTPSFHIIIVNPATNAVKVVLNVTAVNSATQWAVTAEGTDANALAGDAVLGTILTAGAIAALKSELGSAADLLSEARPYGTRVAQKTEKAAFNHGATVTLLNYTGSGYVSSFWFASTIANVGDLNAITMAITVDGTAIFSDRACLFFAAEYQSNQTSFLSRFVGANNNNSDNAGYYSHIPIPFSTSITITITNNSASRDGFCWSLIDLQTGISLTEIPRTRQLRCATGVLTNQTVNTVCTLVDVSGLSSGRLLGLSISLDAFPNSANPVTAPLEGNVKIYVDGGGSPIMESPGTEDYFHMSNYFQGYVAPVCSDYVGLTIKSAYTFNMYRFHIPDPVVFSNALKITWNAGDSTQVNFTGGVRIAWCVWYYTE